VVVAPGATDAIRLLEDHEVFDAGAAQLDPRAQAREPRTDDDRSELCHDANASVLLRLGQ
jgi:hypothetical protein